VGFFINILVILVTVIAFLIIYYRTLNKDRKNQDYHLPFKKIRTDYETGEENGVDIKAMSGSNVESNSEKKQLFTDKTHLKNDSSGDINSLKKNDLSKNNISQEKYQLKNKYGKNYIRLFSRDPNYLFSYWEINHEEYYNNTPYLRLHNEDNNSFNDLEINHYSEEWYIESQPDKEYRVSIGYKKDGVFYPLETSEKVRTPLDRPSNIIDEHWMSIEELSRYSYKLEMGSLSIIKTIEGRKIQEELEADSLTLIKK